MVNMNVAPAPVGAVRRQDGHTEQPAEQRIRHGLRKPPERGARITNQAILIPQQLDHHNGSIVDAVFPGL